MRIFEYEIWCSTCNNFFVCLFFFTYQAVAEPEKFAVRKQKNNLAKREQKKRKLYERKPELKFKKIRTQRAIEKAGNDE